MQTKTNIQLIIYKKHIKFAFLAITLYAMLAGNCFGQSITWQKTYLYSQFTSGYGVKHTNDGNFIICGERDGFGSFVCKLNPYGDTLWIKYFFVNTLNSLIETSDGSYLVAGNSDENLFLVYLKPSGSVIWTKITNENGYYNRPSQIIITYDGNYLITGTLYSLDFTFTTGYYSKFDNSGYKLWLKYIGPTPGVNSILCGRELSTNGFIMAGSIEKPNNYDVLLVRTDNNGDTLWKKSYGVSNLNDGGYNVYQTNDKGFLIFGNSGLGTTINQLYYFKTDSVGNLLWSKYYTDSSNFYSFAVSNSAVCNPANNIYTIACTKFSKNEPYHSNAFLLQVDSIGNEIWKKSIGQDTLNISGWCLDNCIDSGFVISGNAYYRNLSQNSGLPTYLCAIKTDKNGEIQPVGIINTNNEVVNDFELFQNYPNPFNPITTIKYRITKTSNVVIKLYDLLGREVFSMNDFKQVGSYEVKFDGTNLASGLYFYSLLVNSAIIDTKRMVLLK